MRGIDILVAALAATLHADAQPLEGVWQGTLGNQAIVACFNGTLGDEQTGSYYYERHKQPIHLSSNAGKPEWTESSTPDAGIKSEVTGIWRLSPAGLVGSVHGAWSPPKGGKTLPIVLTRIAEPGNEHACGSEAYNNALEFMPTPRTSGIEEINHHRYRTIHLANVEVLELLDRGAIYDELNRQFRAALPRSMQDLADYFKTRRNGLGDTGYEAEDESKASVVFWNDDWLTVDDYRWYAGTGRNGIVSLYRTYNLHSGERVDVWSWLGAKSGDDSDMATPPAKLDEWLKKSYPNDTAECEARTYTGAGLFHFQLGQDGVTLYEEPYGDGCEREYKIPYAQIWQFLTPAGKAALAPLVTPRTTPR